MSSRLSPRAGGAPLATLQGSKYGFSSFNYPTDIETLSHALLFNINVHQDSKDLSQPIETAPGEPSAGSTRGREIIAQGQAPRYKSTKANQLLGLTRRTTRVARAISLYVPETVVYDAKQQYETPSLIDKFGLGGTAAATGVSAAQSTIGTLRAGLGAAGAAVALTALLGPRALGVLSSIDRQATSVAKTGAQIMGFALNPIIEVLYVSPTLRTFNFDFMFSPRDEQEANVVWDIINEFRRHSAPEQILEGLVFIPPSDFDISFLRKTNDGSFVENTNIPRINSCVLENVQVDYAASGQWSTFYDGMPVQTRMRLSFKELDIITREKIDKGY
jgi:hypothetical protein